MIRNSYQAGGLEGALRENGSGGNVARLSLYSQGEFKPEKASVYAGLLKQCPNLQSLELTAASYSGDVLGELRKPWGQMTDLTSLKFVWWGYPAIGISQLFTMLSPFSQVTTLRRH